MRWTKDRIFHRELERRLEEGMDYAQASAEASEATDEIFYDLADQARSAAKDRDI